MSKIILLFLFYYDHNEWKTIFTACSSTHSTPIKVRKIKNSDDSTFAVLSDPNPTQLLNTNIMSCMYYII